MDYLLCWFNVFMNAHLISCQSAAVSMAAGPFGVSSGAVLPSGHREGISHAVNNELLRDRPVVREAVRFVCGLDFVMTNRKGLSACFTSSMVWATAQRSVGEGGTGIKTKSASAMMAALPRAAHASG
jgi:hypothetical protein